MPVQLYLSFLRTSLLVFATILIFDGGFLFPVTRQLSDTTIAYVANVGVGMFASIPPNEVNTLTAQINERQRELDAREALLAEREISARAYDTGTSDYSTYILSAILFILTALIILNYAMDFARAKNLHYEVANS